MRTIFACLFVATLLQNVLFAEAAPWEVSVDANVTATLNTYSDSWSGDETGSFSWASQLILLLNRQMSKHYRLENTLKLGFGQSKLQDEETEDWSDFQVSTDLIDFETIDKFTFGGFVDPYIAGRLQTTFMDASPDENPKVKYVNPLIFSESFGISRNLVKNDNQLLSTRLGGAAYQRVNRKIETTNDGGIELVTKYNANTKNNTVSYSLFLNLYQALFSSEDETVDTWKTIDVDWQNNLTMNITKYLMVNYMFQLLYDRDISEKARARQTLSLGITFKYTNQKAEEKED